MFTALARKILGNPNERILKGFRNAVTQINALEPSIQALNDAELQAQTVGFKQRLADGETLEQILPEAFATAR